MRTRLDSKTIKKKRIHIPNSSDDERPAEVIEVSDDDLPDPSTLSASMTATVSSTWTSPIFTSFDNKSPSPENNFPNLFDDDSSNVYSFPPSPSTGDVSVHSSGWASTSSLASTSSQIAPPPVVNPTTSFQSFTPLPSANLSTSWASSSSLPSLTSTSQLSNPSVVSQGSAGSSSAAGPARPSFVKRGGKSKGLANPWKR